MNGPTALALGGGQVLLRGPAVIAVSTAFSAALDANRSDGVQPPPQLIALEQLLAAEAMAARGHRFQPVMPASPQHIDMITSDEVATMLDLSPRQVRRRATQLGGRQIAGRWLFPRDAVTAAAPESDTAA